MEEIRLTNEGDFNRAILDLLTSTITARINNKDAGEAAALDRRLELVLGLMKTAGDTHAKVTTAQIAAQPEVAQ
jgi:hypothetical protein